MPRVLERQGERVQKVEVTLDDGSQVDERFQAVGREAEGRDED